MGTKMNADNVTHCFSVPRLLSEQADVIQQDFLILAQVLPGLQRPIK